MMNSLAPDHDWPVRSRELFLLAVCIAVISYLAGNWQNKSSNLPASRPLVVSTVEYQQGKPSQSNLDHGEGSPQQPAEKARQTKSSQTKTRFESRLPERRALLLKEYGGTQETEDSVQLALDWLERNQQKDGSWSLSGPYAGGYSGENTVAATGMALLALQGAGYVHNKDKDNRFSQAVAAGWKYLLDLQDKEGAFYHNGPTHPKQYSEAICAQALCELYGMSGDERLQEPAKRALEYAFQAQGGNGGWRYSPGQNGDTSVTGWYMMAFHNAREAKLGVSAEVLQKTSGFLDSVQKEDGSQYGYLSGLDARASMTAVGLLCRQQLGWEQDDARLLKGVDFLIENQINWKERNVYYWYYATQVLFHTQGEPWKKWNTEMRKVLPSNQIKQGKERGSWSPEGDQWGPQAGRLYVTCLHTCMLEVYYRHSPLYEK